MTFTRLLALLLCAGALCACDDTRFASDLTSAPRACEADLSGTWRIDDDNSAQHDYLRVNADCAITLLTQKSIEGQAETQLATVTIHPNLVRVEREQVLTVTDADARRFDAMDEPGKDEPVLDPPGFHYYRVETKGKRLVINGVDHRAIAHALIDDKVEGDTRKKDRNLTNFVRGDVDAMRKLVKQRWLFERDHPLELTKIDPATLPERLRAALDGNARP